MSKRKKILSGFFALMIGLSVAVPMRASAEEYNHHPDAYNHHADAYNHHANEYNHRNEHHWYQWRWNHYQDHSRAYAAPGYAYGQRGYIPANGEGMVDPRNPNLYWACDSEGHHCHWSPR
jgi:hypothetical protein